MQNSAPLIRLAVLGSITCLAISLVYFINGLTVPSGEAVVRPISDAARTLGPQAEIETVRLSHFGFSRWEATVTRIDVWGFWGILAVLLALVALQAARFGSVSWLWMFQPSPFLRWGAIVMVLLSIAPGAFQAIAGATVIRASGTEALYEPMLGFNLGWLIAAGLLVAGCRRFHTPSAALPRAATTAL